jgi:hypothetical protein
MSAEDIAYSGLAEAAMVGIMNEADRARTLNMEIEVDLTHTGGPLGYVLLGWREDAKQALINLAVQDPNDTEAIRALQNKVVIYLEAIATMAGALSRGQQLWKLDGGGRDELGRLVGHVQYPDVEEQEQD